MQNLTIPILQNLRNFFRAIYDDHFMYIKRLIEEWDTGDLEIKHCVYAFNTRHSGHLYLK